MKSLDYTLYSKVKEKFPPASGVAIFVSLAPSNLEELKGIVLGLGDIGALRTLAGAHADKFIPYAIIHGLEKNEFTFYFGCSEFEQEENLLTGEILAFSLGTYNNKPIDTESVIRDLQRLASGFLPGGNA